MARKRKPKTQGAEDDDALLADVHGALTAAGWAVPEAERDVLRAEQELAAARGKLPKALADPQAVLDGKPRQDAPGPGPLAFPVDPDTTENLARAAREGGRIPPDIEEVMRRDREAAEKAFEEQDHGEDVG